MSTSAMPASATVATTTSDATRTAAIRIGAALIVSGLAFLVLALDAPAVLGALYELIAAAGTDARMTDAARFGAVLFGALTFGWGVTILQLGRGRTLDRAIATGTIAWFVVDSAASVLSGFPGNVVLNIGFAVVVLGLLRLARR